MLNISDCKPNADSVSIENLPKGELVVTAKINGDFNVFLYERGQELQSLNRFNTMRTEVYPHIRALRESLDKWSGVNKAILYGETYSVTDGKLDTLGTFIHKVRSKDLDLWEDLRVGIFDIQSVNGKTAISDYAWRLQEAKDIFEGNEYVSVVPFSICKTLDEVKSFWDEYRIKRRYEGLMVRDISGSKLYKVKPFNTIDGVVLGINKREGLTPERVTSLKIGLMTPEGFLLDLVDVGVHDHKLRVALAKFYLGSDKLLYEGKETIFVKPILILEIGYIECLKSVRKLFDRQLKEVGSMEFLTLVSPQILKIRKDKEVTTNDLRLTQLELLPGENII